ncbi:formimidoylglutamate deiminase [Spongiimicrobium sp. 3-5]|uniref:formimidoylglutamate deiminase n=1 Tax=Spongiimicrobium sp. 3-5 TaxID=3332596 RepID=UPI0039814F9A
MKTYLFKGILQNNGWLPNMGITVNTVGTVTDIFSFDPNIQTQQVLGGYALPAFQNAHSHAFQYAMAGLAERHENKAAQDDFWGWREAMYQLALSLDPDQMEAVATMLYTEMARHGYTNVAEFHYVHHDKNGKPYANLAEMGSRLISAAKTVGLGITLVPIFYQKGGFGLEPNERQRRFISPTIEDYLKLLEASKAACKHYSHANIAMGIHSMRGVEPLDIVEIAKSGPQDFPFHIHVSEQKKEVADAMEYLGKRPVQWLLDNVGLNDRFHLVHATHLSDDEIARLAKSKTHVVLCPSTEGNLGDGLFPLRKYEEHGGKWSIGTDSHVGLSPVEELRILDYGQRLTSHNRNSYSYHTHGDSGMHALEMATLSGRKAMGNTTSDFFKIGQPLNACVIDASAPLIASSSMENLASTIVYAGDPSLNLNTISHGQLITRAGVHQQQVSITQTFLSAMETLKNR